MKRQEDKFMEDLYSLTAKAQKAGLSLRTICGVFKHMDLHVEWLMLNDIRSHDPKSAQVKSSDAGGSR